MGRDYHGSRTYDADEPRIGRTNLAFAWALSSAKRRLRNLLLWAAPPSSSRTLLQNGKRSFSELGARSPKANDNEAAAKPPSGGSTRHAHRRRQA